ncbi:MAG: PIN domain-containing protein [Ardenticatenales bacterium]|nr:PIN domain-containing protein [Ardenticatenales bacterium]
MREDDPRTFVDTNILIYAHDRSAGHKHEVARDLIRSLWDSGRGCLSVQVLQEFYVNITRKVPHPLNVAEAADIVSDLSTWDVHTPTAADVLDAIRLAERYGITFWDAMILVSAQSLGCEVVWSEDLNASQRYGSVQVLNPLAG